MNQNKKRDPNRYPPGWDAARVRAVLEHYENQTEDEAVAEDEAAFADPNSTVMVIPHELVPAVHALLAKHLAAQETAKANKTKRPARRKTGS